MLVEIYICVMDSGAVAWGFGCIFNLNLSSLEAKEIKKQSGLNSAELQASTDTTGHEASNLP